MPHLFVPGIISPSAGQGLHSVSRVSPLHQQCKQLCSEGGRYNFSEREYFPVYGFKLVEVQAIVTSSYNFTGYCARQEKLTQLRKGKTKIFNADTDTFTLEQKGVLSMLRSRFHERVPGTKSRASNTFYCYHGPQRENLEKVCLNGFVATKGMDAGYFGSGCYATLNIEYALRYVFGDFDESHGWSRRGRPADGRYPVILFAAATGMAYPITREVDYPSPSAADEAVAVSPVSSVSSSSASPAHNTMQCKYFGKGLKSGFDCHVICVNQHSGFQAVSKKECQYVEVVLDQEFSLLPLAVLWFEEDE
jgi:hypothetical protein